MNKRIISRKQLEGKTKYEYCPWCVTELENEGKDWKELLRPLFRVKTAEPFLNEKGDYTGKDIVETHYECSRCKSERITVDTFVRQYCCRADGTKYTEPPKTKREGIDDRRAAASEMAYAKATESAV